jgi:hypothetical protein
MRALLDESVPKLGFNYAYVVVGTILVDTNDARIDHALEEVVGGRAKPFHWHKEGVEARTRMIKCLTDLGACAHVAVHYPTGRRRQESARRLALERVLPLLLNDGAVDLLIESRGAPQDGLDRGTLLDGLAALDRKDVTYAWGNKTNSQLWLPDAVCGAVADYLTGQDRGWYESLCGSSVITEPIYLTGG